MFTSEDASFPGTRKRDNRANLFIAPLLLNLTSLIQTFIFSPIFRKDYYNDADNQQCQKQ